MNAFTIDTDNNITVHATKKAARETGAGVFDSPESLTELMGADGKRMIEVWNSLTGVTPVKKFTSRAVAAKRIFAELQKLVPPPAPEAPAGTDSAAPNKAAKKEKPKPGGKRDILLGLISRKNGASLEELMAALAWQKHSVRGFIATLGKTMSIESFKTEQGVRTYRIPVN